MRPAFKYVLVISRIFHNTFVYVLCTYLLHRMQIELLVKKDMGIVRNICEIFLALWLVIDPAAGRARRGAAARGGGGGVWGGGLWFSHSYLIRCGLPLPCTHSAVDLNGFIIRFVRLKCTFWKTKKISRWRNKTFFYCWVHSTLLKKKRKFP